MKVRLSELAHIAEIIGAGAVVISLVYVGLQVNHSVDASRSVAVNDATVALQDWYHTVGSSQQASELFYRGLMSSEALAAEEEFQFLMMMHGIFLSFQNSYWLTEEGTLDRDLLSGLTAAILGVKDAPGTQRYWRQRKSYLNPTFGEYVDDLMARETNPSMDIYQLPPAQPESN